MTASRAAVAIVALAVIVWAAAGDPEAPRLFGAIARVALVFSLIALAPAVIATPVRQIIMIDHFMWSLFFVCLLACWAGVHLVDRLRPRLPTDIAASR